MSRDIHPVHDRYTRILVTVAAAGVWALTGVLLATTAPAGRVPDDAVRTRPADASAQGAAMMPVSGEIEAAAALSGSAATLPLRWVLPYARNQSANNPGDLECLTIIRLTPLPGLGLSINVEVEFFDTANGLDGTTVSIPGLVGNVQVTSDLPFSPDPIFSSGTSGVGNTGFLLGSARVYASDPRLLIAPYLLCEDSADQSIAVVAPLPAVPIGATLDFFKAGVPGSTVNGLAVSPLVPSK